MTLPNQVTEENQLVQPGPKQRLADRRQKTDFQVHLWSKKKIIPDA